ALSPDTVIGGNGMLDSLADGTQPPGDPQPEPEEPTDPQEPSDPVDPPDPVDPDPVDPDPTDPPPPPLDEPDIIKVTWNWGTKQSIDFNPLMDQLDFGWMGATAFDLNEQADGVVISIVGNNQTYLLQGLNSNDLTLNNI